MKIGDYFCFSFAVRTLEGLAQAKNSLKEVIEWAYTSTDAHKAAPEALPVVMWTNRTGAVARHRGRQTIR